MYKVLIADDKQYEREYLCQFVEKHYPNDLKVVFEAADGEEVLRQIPIVKPDLLLLDIVMPRLDGLETAEQVKRIYPSLFIVLISAHAEFSYAKQALKIGVSDYLLKPYLDDELKGTLDSVLIKVDKVRGETANLFNEIHQRPDIQSIVEKDIILHTIFNEKKPNLESLFFSLGIEVGYIKCIVFYSHRIAAFSDKDFTVVKSIFQKKELKVVGCMDMSQLVMWAFGTNYADFNEIDNCIKRSRKYISEGEQNIVFCGVSGFYSSLSAICEAYGDAVDLIEQYSLENVRKELQEERSYCRKIYELEKQISVNIINKKLETTMGLFTELYNLLSEYKKKAGDGLIIKYRLRQTIYYVMRNVNELLNRQDDSEKIIQAVNNFEKQPDTQETIISFWTELTEFLISEIGRLTVYNNIQLVRRAKNYIFKHYQEKISLQSIAEDLNISFGYLSKCFKQVEGVPLSEYLVDLRMENAKKLMRLQNGNISEVCFQVGFTDPNYFSKCFKKKAGMSPTEYCQMIILENL